MSLTASPVSFLAIGLGAAVGAWIRWGLGLALNPLLGSLPLGTLAANLLGGLMMGVALAFLHVHPGLSAPVKLMLTTGFLGGLTTFSTFSAEGLHLLQREAWGWLMLHTVSHVAGALFMAWAGFTLFNHLRG